MGTLREWQKLVPTGEGHLMPFILRKTTSGIIEVGITRNTIFFTPPIKLRLSWPRTGILKNCKYLRDYELTEADTKELQAIYPGFCFTYLSIFVRLPLIRDIDVFGAEDMILMEKTEYNKVPLPDFPMMNFFISNNQYSKWFKNTYEVLYKTSIVDIPESMTHCEKLFDKNVLPIKKLVKDFGNLHFIDEKVRKNYFLYDDSNLITNTFFTELNKKIQSYRMISLEYSKDNKSLINSKNWLKFNVFNNIQKEYLTLQLEDILTPKKLKQLIQKLQIFQY